MLNTVFITGATSMIGLATLNKYLEKGHPVIACVRQNSQKRYLLPESKLLVIIESEASNYNTIMERYPNISCNIFFHFAWEGAGASQRNDVLLQNQNIQNTLEAIILAKKLGAKKFIGSGSQAEYGRVEGKISETEKEKPENAYGIAKYTAGKFSKLLCESFGINFNWARIFSIYGIHDAPHTLISYCINSLLENKSPSLTKGEQIWDYLYIDDLAEALYLIEKKGISGKTYNIGSGKTKPLHKYVKIIRNQINTSVELNFGEKMYSNNQVMHLCADISLLANDTGFTPKTSFEEGIKKVMLGGK